MKRLGRRIVGCVRTFRRQFYTIVEVLAGLSRPDTWKSMGQVDVLMLCHDADRAYSKDGRAYCQLLDPVREELEELGYTVATIAHQYSRLTGRRAFGSPFSCNRMHFRNAIWLRASRLIKRPAKDVRPESGAEYFWHRLLEQTKPRVILLIGAPEDLCRAAGTLHIPAVELIHGYRIYPIFWGYEHRVAETLPDHFLALDQLSLEAFEALSKQGCRTSLVRRPALPPTVEIGWPASSQEFQPKASRSQCGKPNDNRPLILVALQWGYRSDDKFRTFFENGLFPASLEQLIRDSERKYRWALRLHPVQLRGTRYRKQRRIVESLSTDYSHVCKPDFSQLPLELLLPEVSLVLTPGSSVASEALDFGIPIIFYDPHPTSVGELHLIYRDEISRGIVTFWDSQPSSLAKAISDSLAERPVPALAAVYEGEDVAKVLKNQYLSPNDT